MRYSIELFWPTTIKVIGMIHGQLNLDESSSSSGSCVPWLGEGLSVPPPSNPVLPCPLLDRIPQVVYLSRNYYLLICK